MWEKFKSGAVVVFVTLMIWVAADQNVREDMSFKIQVRLTSGDPDLFAMIAELPHQTTLSVTLNARRRRLREFDELVNSRPVFEAVIGRNESTSSQPRLMSTRELISKIPEIDQFGTGYISSVEPSDVKVIIDTYETVGDVRVEPIYGDLKVTASPSPARVAVRLPGFLAERLRQNPVAVAEAEQRIRTTSRPDGSFNVSVPLTIPALKNAPPSAGIKLLPAPEVTIAGQIESLTATKRKGPIQITWSIPDQVQREYRIVVAPDLNFRPDIDVTGPRDLLDQLDPREIRAFVDVYAADAEKPGTPIRRQVQFMLPAGFSLAPGQSYELIFQLEPLGDEPAEEPD